MRGLGRVLFVERNELHAHQVAIDGGHQRKNTVVLRHAEDAAHRLLNLSERKIDQRAFHRRNQCFPGQQRSNLFFVEVFHWPNLPF